MWAHWPDVDGSTRQPTTQQEKTRVGSSPGGGSEKCGHGGVAVAVRVDLN